MNKGFETPKTLNNLIVEHPTIVQIGDGSRKEVFSRPNDELHWGNLESIRYSHNPSDYQIQNRARYENSEFGGVKVHAPQFNSLHITSVVPQIQNFLHE